ncbi:MAG: CsbD family protein [Rhodospirillum sp.]|nr:CsbD family protein [Rhodospirillum sp.]MCF8490096.1 CsbD family protein [Rhodospirillum sp.]MCF8502331.1 CsbD family protein [Rhodospirillum sp.]
MNRDEIEGNWNQLVGKAKEQWGKLTDNDLETARGQHQYLVGKLQERYGIALNEAKREVDAFFEKL